MNSLFYYCNDEVKSATKIWSLRLPQFWSFCVCTVRVGPSKIITNSLAVQLFGLPDIEIVSNFHCVNLGSWRKHRDIYFISEICLTCFGWLMGNSMSTHTLFRIASGICQITILYHQWVNNKQNRPIKSSECPILKKLWSKWRFSPFWLSNTVFFTNRPFFNQIEQFKKEKLSW